MKHIEHGLCEYEKGEAGREELLAEGAAEGEAVCPL